MAYKYALSPGSIWKRYKKNKLAVVGLGILISVAAMAIFAPIFATHDPHLISGAERFLPPSSEHWLGTDKLGRDIYSRIVWGARTSLMVGLLGTLVATAVGIPMGAVAGYFRGWVDEIVMRLTDTILVIPTFFLYLLFVSALRTRSSLIIATLIGALIWPRMARIVRSEFLSIREQDYVRAARGIGAGDFRIIFRHMLPNAMAGIIVTAAFYGAIAILQQAMLAFLGVGDPTEVSWGAMLQGGQEHLRFRWWISTFPGLMVFVTVLAINLIGDGLRDSLDPRLRGKI